MNHNKYDFIVIAVCGKDSSACLLHCIESGFPIKKIELWHHLVDGDSTNFIDWPCSGAYCAALGQAFGIPVYFSGREGGFKRELLRENEKSAATFFETPVGRRTAGGGRGKFLTRRQFPQVGKIEAGRWCSALQKIDVGRTAFNNQCRFMGSQTLFVSGERAEESKQRASYAQFEPHVCNSAKRVIDHWRPVHRWSTQEVWQIIARHKINPHPCYRAGWGRCSCAGCIFSDPDQLASFRAVLPEQFKEMADLETMFDKSIHFKRHKRNGVVEVEQIWMGDRANVGTPFAGITPETIAELRDPNWNHPIFLDNWELPLGAMANQNGPS